MNVVGANPDGWWRDRRGAMERLARAVAAMARQTGTEATIVFDGRPFGIDAAPATVMFATRGGRNAADDDIARLVAEDPDPGSLTVVTSDRDLVERVRANGAAVLGARAFRRELDRAGVL